MAAPDSADNPFLVDVASFAALGADGTEAGLGVTSNDGFGPVGPDYPVYPIHNVPPGYRGEGRVVHPMYHQGHNPGNHTAHPARPAPEMLVFTKHVDKMFRAMDYKLDQLRDGKLNPVLQAQFDKITAMIDSLHPSNTPRVVRYRKPHGSTYLQHGDEI